MADFTNLSRDESVVLQGTIHWARLIVPGFFALLFLIGSLGSDATIGGLVLAIIILAPALIPMFTEQLVITNKRLYGKSGLIKTKTLDTPLNKVNTVSVSSGLIGKVFGYGTVHVSSSSGNYNYSAIKDPAHFRETLMAQIEQYENDRIKKQAEEMARAIRMPGSSGQL